MKLQGYERQGLDLEKGLTKEGWRNGEVMWWQDSELKIKEREEGRERE